MDKFDRIFRLHSILSGRRTPISLTNLCERLECERSTVFRIIASMKNYLGAPIERDRDSGGYRYATQGGVDTFELPGLWFSSSELQALMVLQRLIKDMGGGLLEEHLAYLGRRLDELTRHQHLNLGEASSRLRFPAIAARRSGPAFQAAASATLQRKKVRMTYHARSTDQRTERVLSPQRIVHYRESWYLDAWDEVKQDHRSFSMDRILKLQILDERARDIPEDELDRYYGSAYGIFSGVPDNIAILRFTPERARWVAAEEWHPKQEYAYLEDGTYELKIPYRDGRELVMDLLRHGSHVKVIAPESLRDEVANQLNRALAQYST